MAKKKPKAAGLDIDALIANENIIDCDVADEMESATLTYAIKTIIDRAIPDVRDGLKPVQRRILYGAYKGNYINGKPYTKNAKIVGDVMGNYHPHGDSSIYETMVGMSQDWNYRYPLVDFQGNNGSYDGDPAAAYRYTEGRLQKIAMSMLEGIDEDSVKFKPNYSEKTTEPEVLPGVFPNILLNGTSGIAVGYSTRLPSHQLGEVCDGIIEVIKNPSLDLDGIMKHIKAPDFAGGGFLVNNSNIKSLYETGKGSLTFKAKYDLESNDDGSNSQIVFTELPPDVNKPKLVEKIHKLCLEDKVIPRVLEVKDLSKGADIRLVIELHKTAVPEIIINELYERTELQKNMTYVLRVIVNKAPKCLGLKQLIEYYIEHRRECVKKRIKYLRKEANDKLHIQEGLKKVTADIDAAIDIIKNSDTTEDAKKNLIAKFTLSDKQVVEVLEIKLRQLTKLNRTDIDDVIAKLIAEIAKLDNVLANSNEIDKIIIKELHDLKKNFNDVRKTILVDEMSAQTSATSNSATEPIALVLTSKNTIKHITLKALDDMFKNGALKERTEVFIQGVKCKMSDQFILVLNTGEYVKIEFGDLMTNMSFLDEKKHVIKAIVIYDEEQKDRVVMTMTKKGIIQKVKMCGFRARMRRVAPMFKEMQDKDEIIGVRVVEMDTDNIITIATKEGSVHRFFDKSFKEMESAGGKGINGITLTGDDEVVSFDISKHAEDDKTRVVLFTSHDDGTYGMKSMPLTEFKPKGRISQGIVGVDFAKKQKGNVFGLVLATDDFFAADKKGNVSIYKFVNLPEHNRYNKPEAINNEVSVLKFFLE